MLQKSLFEEEKQGFSLKMVYHMLKKPFFSWQNVVFTNEARVRISRDGIVRVFEEMDEISWKKQSSDKRSLMFWGAIRSDGRKLLVKCPNKLNAVGYLEIFKIYEEKMHFLETIFQQNNAPLHKLKFIGNFFQENEWKVLEWPA